MAWSDIQGRDAQLLVSLGHILGSHMAVYREDSSLLTFTFIPLFPNVVSRLLQMSRVFCFALFCFVFETGFLCIVPVVLEFTL